MGLNSTRPMVDKPMTSRWLTFCQAACGHDGRDGSKQFVTWGGRVVNFVVSRGDFQVARLRYRQFGRGAQLRPVFPPSTFAASFEGQLMTSPFSNFSQWGWFWTGGIPGRRCGGQRRFVGALPCLHESLRWQLDRKNTWPFP